jgi:hypothetical protein
VTDRALSTRWIVALALVAGAGMGYLGGRERADAEVARQYGQFRAAYLELRRKAENPEAWRRDSAEFALRETRAAPRRLPLELKREQVMNHCAVTFLITDSTLTWARLFYVQAKDLDGREYGRGYLYRDKGFQSGDSVTVVVPETSCQTSYFSFGFNLGGVPVPLRLDVR